MNNPIGAILKMRLPSEPYIRTAYISFGFPEGATDCYGVDMADIDDFSDQESIEYVLDDLYQGLFEVLDYDLVGRIAH